MSYCRFGNDSDVYLSSDGDGRTTCYACRLRGLVTVWSEHLNRYIQCNQNHQNATSGATLRHLYDHIRVGHKVPKRVIKRVKKDLKKEGMRIIHEKNRKYQVPAKEPYGYTGGNCVVIITPEND